MILEGTTSSGAVVPVQVTDDGKVVAEGRTGPEGPEGPQGPEGPPGPASDIWERSGTVVSPINDGDAIATTGVFLTGGATGTPLRRDTSGRLLVGSNGAVSIAGSSAPIQGHGNKSAGNLSLGAFANNLGGPILAFGSSRSTTVGTAGARVSSGDILGDIRFAGDDGTDINTTAASIRGEVDGAPDTNDMPGRLVFHTTPSGTALPVERLRINQAGVLTLGNSGTAKAVTLDPGSTGSPLVRDSTGRLLVGMNSAPAGTLAGDVVCQGALVLQSPDGMWWAIEVANDGTLFAAQTSIR